MCDSPPALLFPEPPAALRHPRVRHLAGSLGPGIIIASVTIGSGELVFASRSGAIFGYGLLWCFLYAGVFKAIQVYTAARHITLTGEHPLAGWAQPRRFPVLPLLIALPAVLLMPVAFSAIPEILGGFLDRLTESSMPSGDGVRWSAKEFRINIWTSIVMLLCLSLALASSMQVLERVSAAVLGIIVVCVALAVMRLGPDLTRLISGILIPHVGEYPDWLTSNAKYSDDFSGRSPWLEVALYLTAVGGGAFDYIGYVGMLRKKQWGLAGRGPATRHQLAAAIDHTAPHGKQNLHNAKIWTRAPLIDITLSFFFVILITLLFAVLGSLLLHTGQTVPANNELLTLQEQFLVTLHPELKWLYRAGVFLAFVGTLYGAYKVYQHTFVESAHAIFRRLNTPAWTRRCRMATIVWCFAGGMVMIWLPSSVAGSIVDRMTFGSILSGAAACGVWCFAMIVLDYVRLPPPLRMSPLLRTLTAIAGIVMTGLGVQTTIAWLQSS